MTLEIWNISNEKQTLNIGGTKQQPLPKYIPTYYSHAACHPLYAYEARKCTAQGSLSKSNKMHHRVIICNGSLSHN